MAKEYQSNLKKGRNPFTGKEYFLIVEVNKKWEVVDTFQTYIGAKKNRKKGQMIMERKKLLSKVIGWRDTRKKLRSRISRLTTKKVELLDSEGHTEGQIKNIEDKITYLTSQLSVDHPSSEKLFNYLNNNS